MKVRMSHVVQMLFAWLAPSSPPRIGHLSLRGTKRTTIPTTLVTLHATSGLITVTSIYAHHYSTGTCCIIHLNNRSCHSDNTSTSVLVQEQKFQCLGFFCESDIAILSLKRQCHMLPFARHRTAGIMGP